MRSNPNFGKNIRPALCQPSRATSRGGQMLAEAVDRQAVLDDQLKDGIGVDGPRRLDVCRHRVTAPG